MIAEEVRSQRSEIRSELPPLTSDLRPLTSSLPTLPIAAPAAELVRAWRHLPQREMPVTHRFQPGIYIREIFMPADTWVIGYRHKTRHWNIVMSGLALVFLEGSAEQAHAIIHAGMVFESGEDVQKKLYIKEDCQWLTIHANPDDCTDIATLEERLLHIDPETLAAKGSADIDTFRMSVNPEKQPQMDADETQIKPHSSASHLRPSAASTLNFPHHDERS